MLFPLINVLHFDVSTFRSMCAVFSMAVFCSSLISCLRDMLPRYLLSDFETHPVDSIINRITCFYSSYALYFYWRFLFFRFFSASVLITFLSSGIPASINISFYVSLSRIRMSGLLLGMVLSVCTWFHNMIILLPWLFSPNFGTCFYLCSFSKFTPIALHMVKFISEHTLLSGSFNIFPASLYIWEIQNNPIKIAPLCNYTLFLVTVKVLETFLEVILWKPFKLFRRILNDVSSRPFNADFRRDRGNGQNSAGDRSGGYGWRSSLVTLFFNEKSLTKSDRCVGTLSWRRNQLFFLHFSELFFLTGSLWRRRILLYFSLFTVLQFPSCRNSCNYTSEFRDIFDAPTYYYYYWYYHRNHRWFLLMQIWGCTL
jgi:hypothetical protein